MTQEEKQLVLITLCEMLPYGVMVADFDEYGNRLSIPSKLVWLDTSDESMYKNLKPYLRSMSSMTEEENKEYYKTFRVESYGRGYVYVESIKSYDWLNVHHFDYRGLIEKGLALEATKENNPYKK